MTPRILRRAISLQTTRSGDSCGSPDKIQVVCPDCGGRAEARLEPSGLENYIIPSATNCKRNLRGLYVVACPELKESFCGQVYSCDQKSMTGEPTEEIRHE
jgi:hypothetical protein